MSGTKMKTSRLMSDDALRRESADSLERLYDSGRLSKKDVIAWVRMSAKMSGRIYVPGYVTGRYHDHLRFRRREDLEEHIFTKKKSRTTRRDPRRARRDEVPSPRRHKWVEDGMLLGFLEAIWLDSYMSWADEHGHGYTTGHIPQHVRGLSDIPQAPPLAAKKLAKKYASLLVKMNKASLTQIYDRAAAADEKKTGEGYVDAVKLGFYLAMQSRGHGVGWTDDHAAFKVVLPSAEWYAYGSKGRVRVEGYVSERFPGSLR